MTGGTTAEGRRRARAGLVLAALCLGTGIWSAPVSAQDEAPNPRLELPRSRLGRPFTDRILLVGYAALGGGLHSEWQSGRIGYGGAIVFRPGSAVNFLDFLYDWHAGGVLQVDHQNLGGSDEVLAIDGIIRRYFGDRGSDGTEVMIFAGAGLGAARFDVPGTDGLTDKYLCSVFELGQEWLVDGRGYFFVKGQFRYHLHRDHNYRVWSIQAGAGVPLPW